MKRLILSIALHLFCQMIGFAASDKTVRLHTVEDFSMVEEIPGSHVGFESNSVLEAMYGYMTIIPDETLTRLVPDNAPKQKKAVYPRIKKLNDGNFIMFYQGASVGSRIFCTLSADLKEWSDPVLVWKPYAVTCDGVKDIRRFSTADAVVLPDGEILVVCSYRATKGYKNGVDCGITLKRSRDNGKTWTAGEIIYRGTNWEPYLLYLPDGSIHCYFTDCIPAIGDSGVSMIVSHDGGRTWGEYKKVSRQFKHMVDGHRIFTDQMPSVRLLNDGKTLCGFFEARLEQDAPDGGSKSIYKMSLVYNDGYEWADLGNETAGPKDRQTNLFVGAGGYISVFPSGETLLSCNIDRQFSLKVGDASARHFNGRDWDTGWVRPFEGRGFWGATEVVSDHEVAVAMHSPDGISVGKLYLNHMVRAQRERIEVDGDGREWNQKHLFYLGSDSPAQAIIRAAYDSDYLYLLIERSGKGYFTDIYLHNNSYPSLTENASIHVRLSEKKTLESRTLDNCGQGKRISVNVSMRPGISLSGKKGIVQEIAVPLSYLNMQQGDAIMFNCCLSGNGLKDSFDGAEITVPSTWQKILLD